MDKSKVTLSTPLTWDPKLIGLLNESVNATATATESEGVIGWEEIVIGLLSCLLAALTIFGNTLVILAVYRERQLRTVTNLYLVSLACADFLIGTVVLPFAIYLEVTGGAWPYGDLWCDLWHAFDVLGCTASILNLCMIACDRYWAITRPFSYPTRMTKGTAGLLIGAAWVCSALISFPCIGWWRAVEPPHPPLRCIFPSNTVYLITSSCISFYFPSAVMIFLYMKIYRTAVEQVRAISAGTKRVKSANGNGVAMRVHKGGTISTIDGTLRRQSLSVDTHLSQQVSQNSLPRKSSVPGKRLMTRLSREHKAARTLGIVMGIFIICWLPFFIVNVTAPVCPTCYFHPIMLGTVTWLGYINSALNPVIYAFASRRFKNAFTRILCSSCERARESSAWSDRVRSASGSVATSLALSSCHLGDPSASVYSDDIASADTNSTAHSNSKYSLPHTYF